MQERKISFTRFLVGSFMHENQSLCIADIPISLHYFSVWFSKKVIEKGRTIYSFNEFIRDLFMDLVAPVLGQRCKQDERNKTVRPMTTMFLLEGEGKDGKTEPLSKSDRIPKEQGFHNGDKNCSFHSDKVKSLVVGQKVDKPLDCIESKKGGSYFEYFFIHFTEETKDYRIADYKKDVEDGIYHFFPGMSTGIVKEVKFTSNTQEGLKEALMQGTNLEWLKRLYDADLKMFGIPHFVPGNKLYINTEAIGLGIPGNGPSLSTQLGLGGYYIVVNVKGSIEMGRFESEIKCRWESRGDGDGFKNDKKGLEKCKSDYLDKLKKVGFDEQATKNHGEGIIDKLKGETIGIIEQGLKKEAERMKKDKQTAKAIYNKENSAVLLGSTITNWIHGNVDATKVKSK
jgi:hypothetical protein